MRNMETSREIAPEKSPFDRFERDDAFEALANLMRGPRPPIALVGAGASVGSGYVSWPDLLKELEKAAGSADQGVRWKAILEKLNDAPWTAEVHYRAMGKPAFERLITGLFQPKPTLGEPHLTLGRMAFRHFLTTNYDSSIEDALKRAGHTPRAFCWDEGEALAKFLIRLGDPSDEKFVVYLHGRYDRPDSIILTEGSYVTRYVASDDARSKLLAIFMTHPVVFIGFSMNDPDFANFMREVTARLKVPLPSHFALLGYSTLEEREAYQARMLNKYGVRPIFYHRVSRTGHDEHDNLLHLLDALAGQPPRPFVARSSAVDGKKSPVDLSDPQKGQWGGLSEAGGRRLRAEPRSLKAYWFSFDLIVEATDGKPLAGAVEFHLHDTFTEPVMLVPVVEGTARCEITSYGAFTVGALADDGATRLELDLALQSNLPVDWRQR